MGTIGEASSLLYCGSVLSPGRQFPLSPPVLMVLPLGISFWVTRLEGQRWGCLGIGLLSQDTENHACLPVAAYHPSSPDTVKSMSLREESSAGLCGETREARVVVNACGVGTLLAMPT